MGGPYSPAARLVRTPDQELGSGLPEKLHLSLRGARAQAGTLCKLDTSSDFSSHGFLLDGLCTASGAEQTGGHMALGSERGNVLAPEARGPEYIPVP